jgi:hypothetical protein
MHQAMDFFEQHIVHLRQARVSFDIKIRSLISVREILALQEAGKSRGHLGNVLSCSEV